MTYHGNLIPNLQQIVERVEQGMCGETDCENLARAKCWVCERKLCKLHSHLPRLGPGVEREICCKECADELGKDAR